MAFFSVNNIAIKGIAAAVPAQVESNWDYELLTESEKKLLVKTTGVIERRKAPLGTTTSDLCFKAAQKLLLELKWDLHEVEALIFVSQSSDYYLPATAIILQDRLGLPKSCMAFDIGLGCSGYVYGLSVLSSIMSTAGIKKGLLMAGDVSTATCSREDKSTYPLFGDAGTVTALQVDAAAEPMKFNLYSDGSGYEAIIIPHGGVRNRASKESFDKKEIAKGIIRADFNLALNGLDVFNFSIKEVPKAIKEFAEKTQHNNEAYDYFLMHQANKLMNETIRKKTKFQPEKVPYSISKYGNTSSASIPLTIVSELNGQVRKEKVSVLMAGFGVGLSWGISSITLNKIVCPDVIEL
jgi:3-oxoacyl-[acyl-carrier-protein] synthase-3